MKDGNVEMIKESSMAPGKEYGDAIGRGAGTKITNDIPVGFDHTRGAPDVKGGKTQS